MKSVASFALLMLVAGFVVAAEYKPLSGQYAITGPTLADPPADEKQDRVVLFLEGDAARDVYRGMTATAKPQVCSPDGAVTKSAGGMECMFDPNDDTYVCWIGMQLASGQAVQVDVPC